jgi:peptidoglycan/xylan/chitin deacetylase (PgdA/CDA1 family)
MKIEKTLLFTFDYELFLGKRSGNVLESVITPTQEVLNILNEYAIRAIFFVDTTWLIKLKELARQHPKCANKLNLISSQLLNIIEEGHDVFPHLHPHWMDAVYNPDTDEFNLQNLNRYRINQLNDADREKLFDESITVLKDIINVDFPDYKINGFRAGGWSIQPFSHFKYSFKKHGIMYDFSVMPLVYQFSDAQQFDFSNCPNKPVYRFTEYIEQEEPGGEFIEITSNIIYIENWIKTIDKIHQKILFKIFNDSTHLRGVGINSSELNHKPKSIFGVNLNSTNYERVSIELLTRTKLNKYKQFISDLEFVQFVSHPKIVTQHNLKMLKCLLKFANEHFNIKSDFRYFSEQKLKSHLNTRPLDSHSLNVTYLEGIST